ncbi:class I SAM-dependent methyltransferase [Roseateles sp.]|uniref:class I SAM-dependent methyltransferase n=1 Tax=Roseateles sp. TaxID=1971397 RepID=UPI0037C6233A
MENLQLLVELHLGGERQGPGGDGLTRQALALSGLAGRSGLKIADIGCGTGASTLVLARDLEAEILAIDFLPSFLDALNTRAAQAGLGGRIRTLAGSMESLPLQPGTLDAIWSEGAIYNIGFERGLQEWRRYLKVGGVIAVSELTWLSAQRPAEIDAFWRAEYAEVDTASAKLALLERNGYSPLGYFALPESSWLDAYYRPLQARFAAFLAAHQGSAQAQAVVDEHVREMELYERYRAYFSYGFYIARKLSQD